MTNITITPHDLTTTDDAPVRRVGRIRWTAIAGAFALGGLLGSAVTLSVSASDAVPSTPRVTAAQTASSAPIAVASESPQYTSADAAERRAEAKRLARVELCSSSPRSADALERCLAP